MKTSDQYRAQFEKFYSTFFYKKPNFSRDFNEYEDEIQIAFLCYLGGLHHSESIDSLYETVKENWV